MYKLCNAIKAKIAKTISQIIIAPYPNGVGKHPKRIRIERAIGKLLGVRYHPKIAYNGRYIYPGQAGSDQIYKLLQSGKPCLVARLGRVEMLPLSHLLRYDGFAVPYSKNTLQKLSRDAGFFPATDEAAARFASDYAEALGQVDILCALNMPKEEVFVRKFAPHARLIDFECSCPVQFNNPWSRYLAGKKVLVIHPFAESIRSQWQKREHLFENKLILPDFDLITLKAVQSIADNKADLPFADWFEALESMCLQISEIDFDIALIGAGAYGIFLGAYCKQLGKQAVHMGGYTQVLFGISGARYDGWIEKNEYWVRPSEAEKPKGYEKVEDGCYW